MEASPLDRLTATLHEGIATIALDDRKVNALDLDLLFSIRSTLSTLEGSQALVLTGRPGVFTGGLNVRLMESMPDNDRVDLFVEFGRLLMELWLYPLPV